MEISREIRRIWRETQIRQIWKIILTGLVTGQVKVHNLCTMAQLMPCYIADVKYCHMIWKIILTGLVTGQVKVHNLCTMAQLMPCYIADVKYCHMSTQA